MTNHRVAAVSWDQLNHHHHHHPRPNSRPHLRTHPRQIVLLGAVSWELNHRHHPHHRPHVHDHV